MAGALARMSFDHLARARSKLPPDTCSPNVQEKHDPNASESPQLGTSWQQKDAEEVGHLEILGETWGNIIILEMFFWRLTIVYWHEHNLDVWLAHPQQFLELRLESVVKTPCQVNQDTTNCPPERHAPCRLPRVETCQALEILAKLRTYGAQSDGGYIVHCTSSKLHTHIYIYHIYLINSVQ